MNFLLPKMKLSGRKIAAGVLVFGIAVSCWFTGSAAAVPVQDEPLTVGVVDFGSLIKEHPDYDRLSQLDEQIGIYEQELQFLPLSDQRRAADAGQKKMEDEVAKAHKELEAEYNRINKEMSGLSASMAAQFESEGKALQEHYRHVLDERIKAIQPKNMQPPKEAQAELEGFMQDLAKVREQRVLARRNESEWALQQKLNTRRGELDTALADYEGELMRANQEKRLNLQLKLQTAATPEEEAEIQNQLNALSEEEASAKEARRAELVAAFDAEASSEKAKMEADLAAYEKQLTNEARGQLEAKRQKIVSSMHIPSQAEGQAEVNAQIENIKRTIDAEMQARQKEMQATMQKRSEEAKAKLQKKQAQIEERLKKLQSQLAEMVEHSAENVSEDTRKKMDDTEAKIKELKEQRKELYDAMLDELKGIVGGVAEKQNVPSVVGAYIVNVNCTDLTDLSMVAVKQMRH